MATSLGQAILTLRGDQRPLEGALQSAEKTTQRATFNMAQATRAVGMAFTAAGAAITGALGLSVRTAATFQNAMAEVNTLGIKDLGALGEAVKSVSMDFGLDLLDAVKATYQAISAGATEAQMPKLLAESAKAARAGISDLTTAIGLATSVSNAFGLSLDDVNKIFDQAFIAVRKGVTDFSQLGSTLGQLSPIFAAAKLGTDEMFASVAALTKGGMQTSIAVTGMRAVVASVIKPSGDAAKAAAELGIKFDLQALSAKGLQGFLQEVARATNNDAAAMSRLFPSVEALQSVLALTGAQAGEFDGILRAMEGSVGATDEAFKNFAEGNTVFPWEKLNTTVSVLAIEIGDVLIPIAKQLLDAVTPIIRRVLEWVKANPELTKGLVIAAAAMGGIMLALGPLLFALPGLVVAVGGVVGAFSGVGPVAMGVAAVIGVVLVAAWDYLVAAVKSAREWIERNWDQIVRIYKTASNIVLSVMKILGQFLRTWFLAVSAHFTGWAKGVGDAWADVAGATTEDGKTFLDILEDVLNAVNEVMPIVLDWFTKFANWVSRNWSDIVDSTRWFARAVVEPIAYVGKWLLWLLNLWREVSTIKIEGLGFLIGTYGPQIGSHADGGIVRKPWQLVGEGGPELARLPIGTQVYNARETAGMLGQGGPVTMQTTINFNQVEGDPRKIADKVSVVLEKRFQDRFARRGLRLGTA